MNMIKLALAAAFTTASFSSFAATETATATVKWNAEAVKKSDVSLNVFASADSLSFDWDAKNSRFSNASGSLTVQAAGKATSTAYKITSQLVRNQLIHVSGWQLGTLDVTAQVGGRAMTEVPVDILTGTAAGVTGSAAGLQSMNLATAGTNVTLGGNYHEGQATVDFRIESGTFGSDKTVLALGGAVNGLDKVADGTYEGTIEMAFVASWTTP